MRHFVLGAALVLFANHIHAQEDSFVNARLGKITENLVSYQTCSLDIDCRENSFCYNNDNANRKTGQCKCVQGYDMVVRNRTFYACMKLVNFGEECAYDNQCLISLGSLAKCTGTCGCGKDSYVYPGDGRCYEARLLGDYCKTDANCILKNGSYAYCVDGVCECNIGYKPSADKQRCIVAKDLGEKCHDDTDCSVIGNSVCREVCRCQIGYVVSRNGTSCLKAALYVSDSCEEDDQCTQFLTDTICSNGNCTCQNGSHVYKNKCYKSVGIGQPCTASEECNSSLNVNSAESIAGCIDGLCRCQSGDCQGGAIKIGTSNHLLGFIIIIILYLPFNYS